MWLSDQSQLLSLIEMLIDYSTQMRRIFFSHSISLCYLLVFSASSGWMDHVNFTYRRRRMPADSVSHLHSLLVIYLTSLLSPVLLLTEISKLEKHAREFSKMRVGGHVRVQSVLSMTSPGGINEPLAYTILCRCDKQLLTKCWFIHPGRRFQKFGPMLTAAILAAHFRVVHLHLFWS